MRRLSMLLAFLPLTALAQYPGQLPGQLPSQQSEGPALYPYKKQQLPPGAMYEQGNAGIPTSGIEQGKQLEMNRPGNRKSGPTMIHRNYDKKGSTAVITGPNGTTVCTDSYGKRSSTTICY
jgi:hypothetical protein